MLSPTILLSVALAFAIATGGAFWKGMSVGAKGERANQLELSEAVRQTREAAIDAAATAIGGIEVKYVTINQKAVETVIERPVYRECRHDDDMWMLINASRGYPDWKPPYKDKLPTAPAP